MFKRWDLTKYILIQVWIVLKVRRRKNVVKKKEEKSLRLLIFLMLNVKYINSQQSIN